MTAKEFFRGSFIWLMKAMDLLPNLINRDQATILSVEAETLQIIRTYLETGKAIDLAKADCEIRKFKKILIDNQILSGKEAKDFIDHLAASIGMIRLIDLVEPKEKSIQMFFYALSNPEKFRKKFHNGKPEILNNLNYEEISDRFSQLLDTRIN